MGYEVVTIKGKKYRKYGTRYYPIKQRAKRKKKTRFNFRRSGYRGYTKL